MIDFLLGLGFTLSTAVAIYFYYRSRGLVQRNKLICCLKKREDPQNYDKWAAEHTSVSRDCSPNDDCDQIIGDAGL